MYRSGSAGWLAVCSGRATDGDDIVRIEPEISGVSVVLLGSFNPAIFTPAWFGLQGLLPKAAVEGAELGVAHSSVTEFAAEWLKLGVRPGKFVAETSQAPTIRVSDLVVRTFRELLPHTPIKALGINREVHFRVRSAAQRDRIGRELAPIGPWGEWGRTIEPDGTHGGMISLTMRQHRVEDRPSDDHIDVTVEPSARLGNSGVFVRVNDHYTADGSGQGGGSVLIEKLEREFEESTKRSEGLIDQVMSLAEVKG